jgi:hypothetical protein
MNIAPKNVRKIHIALNRLTRAVEQYLDYCALLGAEVSSWSIKSDDTGSSRQITIRYRKPKKV